MIITLKEGTSEKDIEKIVNVVQGIQNKDLEARITAGKTRTVVEVIGDTAGVEKDDFTRYDCVDRVDRISVDYKLAAKVGGRDNTKVKLGDFEIGGEQLVLMMGPCSVERPEQIMEVARIINELPKGNNIAGYALRGGAFKPRKKYNTFRGHGMKAVHWMKAAGEKYGLPIVTEVMDQNDIAAMYEAGVDMFQVGAKGMENPLLLEALGRQDRPVLLKRGVGRTVEELLHAAEYILAGGNNQVVLCLRGIRTFNHGHLRYDPDLADAPLLQDLTHLPIVFDPSHSTGKRDLVHPVSMQAVAGGADGLIVEVHSNPEKALTDGAQSLFPKQAQGLARAANDAKFLFNQTQQYRYSSEECRRSGEEQ